MKKREKSILVIQRFWKNSEDIEKTYDMFTLGETLEEVREEVRELRRCNDEHILGKIRIVERKTVVEETIIE